MARRDEHGRLPSPNARAEGEADHHAEHEPAGEAKEQDDHNVLHSALPMAERSPNVCFIVCSAKASSRLR